MNILGIILFGLLTLKGGSKMPVETISDLNPSTIPFNITSQYYDPPYTEWAPFDPFDSYTGFRQLTGVYADGQYPGGVYVLPFARPEGQAVFMIPRLYVEYRFSLADDDAEFPTVVINLIDSDGARNQLATDIDQENGDLFTATKLYVNGGVINVAGFVALEIVIGEYEFDGILSPSITLISDTLLIVPPYIDPAPYKAAAWVQQPPPNE